MASQKNIEQLNLESSNSDNYFDISDLEALNLDAPWPADETRVFASFGPLHLPLCEVAPFPRLPAQMAAL